MSVRVTRVHGNDDVVVTTHDTYEDALAAATVSENVRHGTNDRPISSFFVWETGDGRQFGTGYHYVTFERVD